MDRMGPDQSPPTGSPRYNSSSTSAWQLAHKRLHFAASAASISAARVEQLRTSRGKLFVDGSRWWKVNAGGIGRSRSAHTHLLWPTTMHSCDASPSLFWRASTAFDWPLTLQR